MSSPTTVTMHGNPVPLAGSLPAVGEAAPDFTLVGADLSDLPLSSFEGSNVVLSIFPSVDTPTCATSVRRFNTEAASLDNTKVVCVSKDLPFAMARFCGAEGIENVTVGSAFREAFGGQDAYGLDFSAGPLKGLLARAIVVINAEGKVVYTELVPEVGDEPNYEAALASLQ